jgi:TRAP-type mannitol/chloroaromatic compound transport system permease large subunit
MKCNANAWPNSLAAPIGAVVITLSVIALPQMLAAGYDKGRARLHVHRRDQ